MGCGVISGTRALWHVSIDRFFADAAQGDREAPEFDDYLWTDVADDYEWQLQMEQFGERGPRELRRGDGPFANASVVGLAVDACKLLLGQRRALSCWQLPARTTTAEGKVIAAPGDGPRVLWTFELGRFALLAMAASCRFAALVLSDADDAEGGHKVVLLDVSSAPDARGTPLYTLFTRA